jgi:hypothetical protein
MLPDGDVSSATNTTDAASRGLFEEYFNVTFQRRNSFHSEEVFYSRQAITTDDQGRHLLGQDGLELYSALSFWVIFTFACLGWALLFMTCWLFILVRKSELMLLKVAGCDDTFDYESKLEMMNDKLIAEEEMLMKRAGADSSEAIRLRKELEAEKRHLQQARAIKIKEEEDEVADSEEGGAHIHAALNSKAKDFAAMSPLGTNRESFKLNTSNFMAMVRGKADAQVLPDLPADLLSRLEAHQAVLGAKQKSMKANDFFEGMETVDLYDLDRNDGDEEEEDGRRAPIGRKTSSVSAAMNQESKHHGGGGHKRGGHHNHERSPKAAPRASSTHDLQTGGVRSPKAAPRASSMHDLHAGARSPPKVAVAASVMFEEKTVVKADEGEQPASGRTSGRAKPRVSFSSPKANTKRSKLEEIYNANQGIDLKIIYPLRSRHLLQRTLDIVLLCNCLYLAMVACNFGLVEIVSGWGATGSTVGHILMDVFMVLPSVLQMPLVYMIVRNNNTIDAIAELDVDIVSYVLEETEEMANLEMEVVAVIRNRFEAMVSSVSAPTSTPNNS